MTMSTEEQTLRLMRSLVQDMPDDEQVKVNAAADVIRTIANKDQFCMLGLALVSLEFAASKGAL